METNWDILGLQRGASQHEIKSAYRRLARKHHPDANPGDMSSAFFFRLVNSAYMLLQRGVEQPTLSRQPPPPPEPEPPPRRRRRPGCIRWNKTRNGNYILFYNDWRAVVFERHGEWATLIVNDETGQKHWPNARYELVDEAKDYAWEELVNYGGF